MIVSEKIQRHLQPNPNAEQEAQDIVEETLGAGFRVDYAVLPKNTGVMGDQGVRGYSPLISFEGDDPTAIADRRYDDLRQAASRICNETGGACRVLFDITPGRGFFEVALEKEDLETRGLTPAELATKVSRRPIDQIEIAEENLYL